MNYFKDNQNDNNEVNMIITKIRKNKELLKSNIEKIVTNQDDVKKIMYLIDEYADMYSELNVELAYANIYKTK